MAPACVPVCPEVVGVEEGAVNAKMNAQCFQFAGGVFYAKNVRPRVLEPRTGRFTVGIVKMVVCLAAVLEDEVFTNRVEVLDDTQTRF